LRLESRIKKAENRLFGKSLKFSEEQLTAAIGRLQRFPPEELASVIISRSIKVDRFLSAFPLDFQEKVRAAIERLNAVRGQDQEN
jgi:hypothetical protein